MSLLFFIRWGASRLNKIRSAALGAACSFCDISGPVMSAGLLDKVKAQFYEQKGKQGCSGRPC